MSNDMKEEEYERPARRPARRVRRPAPPPPPEEEEEEEGEIKEPPTYQDRRRDLERSREAEDLRRREWDARYHLRLAQLDREHHAADPDRRTRQPAMPERPRSPHFPDGRRFY